MNRNPDDTLLTVEQLENMVRSLGISDEEIDRAHAANDKPARWHSWLDAKTRDLCFEMMGKGQLVLRTELWVAPPRREMTVDWEVVNFLRRDM